MTGECSTLSWIRRQNVEKVLNMLAIGFWKGEDESNAIFAFMTGRMIKDACQQAHESKDVRLPMLIAQAIGSDAVRLFNRKQLGTWDHTHVSSQHVVTWWTLYNKQEVKNVWQHSVPMASIYVKRKCKSFIKCDRENAHLGHVWFGMNLTKFVDVHFYAKIFCSTFLPF